MGNIMESLETMHQLFVLRNVDELKVLSAQLKRLISSLGNMSLKMVDRDIPTRKEDIIQYILECLDDKAILKAIYDRLNSVDQSAVQEVIDSPSSRLDLTRFRAKYGSSPGLSNSWEYFRYANRRNEVEFAWLALWMTSDGIMPRQLRDQLKSFVKPPHALTPEYLESLPETKRLFHDEDEVDIVVHATENAAIRDVMAMLRLLDAGKIGIGAATGKPTKPGAKAIRDILSAGDFYPEDSEASHNYDVQMGEAGIRPFAWAMLMQAANLAQANGNKLGLSKSGTRAMKQNPPELLKQIWDRWLKNNLLHELNRIEIIKGQKSKGRPLAAAAPDRQNIACALAELDEGRWIETRSFFKFLVASGNGITVVRNPWKLYIGDANYGSFGYSHIRWDHVEGRFALAFLLEYAATLGIIDVALIPPWNSRDDFSDLWGAGDLSCLSRYDGLFAIRLNALGAWILGNKKKYEPVFHDEPCFQVLPNMEVSRIGPGATPADVLFLERFSDKVSEQVWRLSAQKMLECTENGVRIDEIQTFLEARNRSELPQTMIVFLKDMKQRTGQVKDLGPARLIECASDAIAQLIANDTKLKGLCILAGDHHLVVPAENEMQFKKALRGLGYGLTSNE
jgi:hypothetical protein